MQLRAEQLGSHLERGLRSLYVLHGDEPLLIQEAGDAVRQCALAQGFGERQSFIVSGTHFDWGSVLAAAQSMGLFAERQIIEIRIPSGKPGKEGSAALQSYCERLSEDVLTLVMLPRLDRTQLASAWFTRLDQAGVSVRIDAIERHALPAWIAQRLSLQNQRVADGEEGVRTLEFFAQRVEGNLLAAHQEVSKLGLLHPPGVLSFEQIENAVLNVARYNVFKLSEAVLAGQLERVMRMLAGLRAEGEAAVLVHWTLAEDILALQRVIQAQNAGQPLALALREARVWGVRERLFERMLPRVTPQAVVHLVQAAAVCDGIVKGLRHPQWPADPWVALERLALNVARLAPAPPKTA